MNKLKVFKVRVVKVWEVEQVAETREEALERVWDFYTMEGFDAEDSNHTTARVVREPTEEERREYYEPEQ